MKERRSEVTKWIVLGIFLMVGASAIAAGVLLVTGQGEEGGEEQHERHEPDGTKIPPIKALKPGEVEIPSGTPVASLTLPMDYGRFHILPLGSAPDVYAPGPAVPPGRSTARVDVRESDTLDEFREHDLFIKPPYIPTGWELTGAHAEAVIWDDGSHTDSMFAFGYERPQYFGIDIKRFLLAPDAQVELLAPRPGGQDALILNEIRGIPVVFAYQGPLQVHFVIGNVVTYVEGVAIDFDELIKIADGLIAQTEGRSP
jgi:hypothetical protein